VIDSCNRIRSDELKQRLTLYRHRKNLEMSKNLRPDTDMKTILLDYQNKTFKHNDNTAKIFDILTT